MLQCLVELTEKMMSGINSPYDLAKYAAIRTFADFSTKQLEISVLLGQSELAQVASWATLPESTSNQKIYVASESPLAESFRTNQVLIFEVADQTHCGSFTANQELGKVNGDLKVYFPMSTTGVISMICDKRRFMLKRDDLFLKLTGSILAFKIQKDFQRNLHSIYPASKPEIAELTDRQLVIAQDLANGLTNREIADKIGYSESLVRQETIRIYKLLQIKGRNELVSNPAMIETVNI